MAESDEPFLSRWSRLKRDSARRQQQPGAEAPNATESATLPAEHVTPESEVAPPESDQNASPATPEQPALNVDDIDFDKLDGTSDYKPFISASVPDEIRSKALSKLWLSDPVLAGPEQLSDYMEDFTDATRAVPAGLLRTAYKVGQGFLSDEEAAEWDRLGRESEPEHATPTPGEIAIREESPDQPDVAALFAASDAPEAKDLLDVAELTAPNARFFVARRGGKALGCGALIISEDGSGELSRMLVAPEARGQGIGRKLLETIEAAARERSVAVLRLETDNSQADAIAFYRRFGFTECEPFGTHKAAPLTAFLEKRLD